ncbi:hypothetical protein EBR21_12445 [bacterium]|nr:hypothetical protein [bacterium]
MAKNLAPNSNKNLIPPNMVAFLAGVALALVVGMLFRKALEKFDPGRSTASLRAQATIIPENAANAIAKAARPTAVAAAVTKEQNEKPIAPLKPQVVESDEPETDNAKQSPEKVTGATKPDSDTDAAHNPVVGEKAESLENNNFPAGEVSYLEWRSQLKALEDLATRQGIKVSSATITPPYKRWAKGLAITRGQFLDVVSRKFPANLPTRPSTQGLVLHALSETDFDSGQFAKAVRDSGIRLESMCLAVKKAIALGAVERITIILDNSSNNFKCLQDWLNSEPVLQNVLELSLIGFTRGPTFFGSLSSEKRLISLQMWNPDWLVDNTVGVDENGRESPRQKRTLRLANVTRALGQPSDVRMQIPALTRSLSGPLVEPKDPKPTKPLIIGNFALVPSHMPRGTLIATAYTNPGRERSRSVSVKPPGEGRARAIVLSTHGKKMQFMTVTKE